MKISDLELEEFIDQIIDSKKYRDSGLNRDTIRDLLLQEAPQHQSSKKLLKSVKRKLHNIVAPYLGEPIYDTLTNQLAQIDTPSANSSEIKAFCKTVLAEHASTKERLPHLEEFYGSLFEEIGKPKILLDLACGLHPLAFSWMGLPLTTQYHAYDIIQPRIAFINYFFRTLGLNPLAENRDILVRPPKIRADLALILKEAHRMEKRQPGCNKALWASLDVETLAVSLPTQNLSGTHSLLVQHRALVYTNLPEKRSVDELLFEDEIVFLIRKIRE